MQSMCQYSNWQKKFANLSVCIVKWRLEKKKNEDSFSNPHFLLVLILFIVPFIFSIVIVQIITFF